MSMYLYTICPAYAGMILKVFFVHPENLYLSRVCGDDPLETIMQNDFNIFVPRMRG